MKNLTDNLVLGLLRDLYGLEGSLQKLPGEYDRNFQVTDTQGREYVLKIMDGRRSRADVELPLAALQHLATAAPALLAPRVILSRAGSAVETNDLSSFIEKGDPAYGDDSALAPAYVCLLTYIPGKVFAQVKPHTAALRRSLGTVCGQITAGLRDFHHAHAARIHKWDGAQAAWIGEHLHVIETDDRRAIVQDNLSRFLELQPLLARTRRQVIHGDANDYNIIVDQSSGFPGRVSTVIDFGDLVESHPICDLAVACAYGLLHQADPLTAAADIVAGYHEQFPLTEDEIALLFPLIAMRLSVSVTNSAIRKQTEDDPYITISEQPAWEALGRLRHIHPRFAHYVFRDACGLEPVPQSARVRSYLQSQMQHAHLLLGRDLRTEPVHVVDLSVGSLLLGADPENATVHRMTRLLDDAITAAGTDIAIGRYDEPRLIYQNDLFATGEQPYTERRTIHIGLDIWMNVGTPIHAPLAGRVALVAENAAALDYGPLLILRHETDEGDIFYTLYGHLAPDVLERWKVGDAVARGDLIAHIGAPPRNGDWAPHLHLQIINDLLERGQDFPGVALASQRPVWRSLSPDPNLLLGIPAERFPIERTYDETLAARKARIGGNLSLSYRQPLKMVRGWKQHLYDHTGRAYLDMYNNVPHVGHSHPHIVRAILAQTALLTTNTRYLHDNILRYAEALCARAPAPLEVCYFVNSASEANELALRLARAYTGGREFIVMDTAYHGHTSSLIDISPYKFKGKGGTGKVDWVHITPVPDDYRGLFQRDTPEIGRRYAAELGGILADLRAQGRRLAGFIAESLPSVGGQIIPPQGYFSSVYEQVRAAGGVCIADEVQVGFGRLGTHFWGFELDQVVPDVIVCGKPVGNGYPLGVVITTRAIADAFDNGMEFFSTFGGNPVACAAGLALLEVLERENLQENATYIGRLLLDGLSALAGKYAIIGDVRGIGLFLGVELVNDRHTLDPAADQASYIVNRLRDHSILAGTDGPLHNVIKLRPAMIFREEDARYFLDTLDAILAEDGAAPRPR